VQRFITLTGHVYSPAIMICNPGVVGRLSPADRTAFQDAARAAAVANRERSAADEASGVDELRRRGMTVVTQVNAAQFQEALTPAFAVYERELDGALLRRIREWQPAR
jgi:TRAP-type C4-dicarboxylate transport system substrate-binding protein